MKGVIKSVLLAFTMLVACSCTEQKVKDYAEAFATAVANNDIGAIAKMYPGAKMAEKLTLELNKDSLSVEEHADTFVVNIGGGKSLSIVKTEEGEYRIADSHGIFSYPAERIDFALKTGWLKPGMSDLEMAEQFADTTFVNYLAKKAVEKIKTQLVVKRIDYADAGAVGYMGYVYVRATIINNSEYEIKGDDYEVTVGYEKYLSKKTYSGYVATYPGKDIKPGEKKSYSTKVMSWEMEGGAAIRFKSSDIDMLARYFKPKGDEYEKYKRSPFSK